MDTIFAQFKTVWWWSEFELPMLPWSLGILFVLNARLCYGFHTTFGKDTLSDFPCPRYQVLHSLASNLCDILFRAQNHGSPSKFLGERY